jgi:hypothetical protein
MNFVEVSSYDNYVTANITLGMLLDAGINCHLKDELTITIDPLLSPMLGGIKIMVYQPQVQRALALLNDREKD